VKSPAERLSLRRALGAVFLALALLSPAALPLRQRLVLVARPVSTWLYRLGVASSPFRLPDDGIAAENRRLESERLRLGAENEALRRQMDFAERSRFKTVSAEVTGRSSDPARRLILIDRGSRDGLAVNMAVMADGYLIGKVIRAEASFSQVQLITDPQFRLTVTAGSAPTPGLAVGSLGGMSLERLLKTEAVYEGDAVLSSDIGGQVASGLPLGTVGKVESRDPVFYAATVMTPVQLENLRFVTVILQ
jgi:rod shape-determining protein MreC